MPAGVREWAEWLPTTSIFETVRYGYFEAGSDEYAHYAYTAGVCLISTWIGLILVRRMREKIHLS